jgi:hypothetical protein
MWTDHLIPDRQSIAWNMNLLFTYRGGNYVMGLHSPSAHPGASQRHELGALWKRSIEKILPFHKKHSARAMLHPGNESPEEPGHET